MRRFAEYEAVEIRQDGNGIGRVLLARRSEAGLSA
jgi:hypothetical protein